MHHYQIQYNERFVRCRSTNRRGAPYNPPQIRFPRSDIARLTNLFSLFISNNKSVRTIKQNSFKSFLENVSVSNFM